MAFNPTYAQQQAIDTEGNVLVSAAAGSGKTAVLVERVIKKLCDKNKPVRADELLIVTFTNAAALEMRSRIEKRLGEECQNHPEDPNLLLQKNLLNNAKICTIDSFCIDLVRENFDKLGVSPDFKIAEENDLKAINEDVLYGIINRYFEEKNSLFLHLLDIVGSEYDERNFAELIYAVYNFSRQLPFPKKWFAEILSYYNKGILIAENPWYKYAFERAKTITDSMLNTLSIAYENLSSVEKALNAYNASFSYAKEQIAELNQKAYTGEWDSFYAALCNFELKKLPIVRGLGDYPQINCAKEAYKYLSGKVLDPLYKLFYNNSSFINGQFKVLYPAIELFVEILNEFEDKVFAAYNEQNIFTFHNTEHLALQLLCKEVNGEILVSENGTELLEQYSEVMVDEYQDTNDLQDMLFYILSNYEKKLFVVGDVKQSIYAFRGANPSNFLQKKERYLPVEEAINNKSQKINLGNNFRSKDEVCDFVNYFFNLFMQKETGSITYDQEEMLIPTAKFPECDDTAVTFDIIDCCETDENANIIEARSIAQFIKKTINGKPCIKQDDNTLRNATYGDFTILLRGVSNKAPALLGELKKQGIPVNMSINNFAESVEINTFLSLLQVIDNPNNDIALATVMLSPIFRFSTDKLAEIRIGKRHTDLYSAVIFAAQNGDVSCKEFLSQIERFRLKSVTSPMPKLVMTLLIETDYLNIVSAMSDGNNRRNNLLLLSDLSVQFTNEKSRSLKSFCDYVLKFSSMGCASTTNDAVKIMSIHASKGLQFPICIVASTTSRFNDNESRNSYAYSTKYGLGFKYYDEVESQKFSTLPREVILDDIKATSLEEELRLLYVAMTRAQDKLHFVSSFSNLETAMQKYKNMLIASDYKVDKSLFVQTNSYSDWLLISLLLHPQKSILGEYNQDILAAETNCRVKVNITNGATLDGFVVSDTEKTNNVNKDFVKAISENFAYEYPYEELTNIQSKISVSVLANKSESEKYAFTSKPAFMSKDGVTATDRGTAMHKIIEFFDFTKSDSIEEEIERLYEWQFISLAERESLDINALKIFFGSEIFKRIKNADRVEREMRFITEIPASDLQENLNDNIKNEKIIVQGAVDICFIENGELVILDFKTDRVGDIEELAVSYGEQLSAYAKACEKIFGLRVKEKIIYSFTKSNIIAIK